MNSANSDKLVTIIGGSGFVGRHVVRALAKRGYRLRVACRRPDLAGHVVPLGTPGQIVPMQANVRYPASLTAACDGAYAVINLAAVFQASGAQTFDGVHVFGAEAVAKAAKAARAPVFIHMSGLGADDTQSESAYVQSRGLGEAKAKAAYQGAMIVRPSVIFGPEDHFLNRFAKMARFSPVLPVIGAETKIQPVFVGDVAEAVARLVDQGVSTGKTYELGGPEVKSMRQLFQYVCDVTYRKRLLLNLPFPLASLIGTCLGWLPGAPITADQVNMLRHDNTVSAKAVSEGRDLGGLGIAPRALGGIAPSYLFRFRKAGQFSTPAASAE